MHMQGCQPVGGVGMMPSKEPEMTTQDTIPTCYQSMIEHVRQTSLLGGTLGVLGWDQETMMPPGGLEYRSRQMSQLAGMKHTMATDPRLGEFLQACEEDASLTSDPTSVEAVNIRQARRAYDKATRLPDSLVTEMARVESIAQHEWAAARTDDDYDRFKPYLQQLLDLSREKASCYGWPDDGEPWDALADNYEPGCSAAEIERVFTPLRDSLQSLVADLVASPTPPSNAFNERALAIEAQERFVRDVSERIGFDFNRGRLDRSTHPFCGGSNCNDVRMTTRFSESNVNDALGSTLHESGHGIYEQGLLSEHVDTPMGSSVSLAIHESQSRMWENQVGRSREYWKWCQGELSKYFGSSLDDLSIDDLYGGANIVRPDFIRVEADEATYNLHIMVRFQIERPLISGDLGVDDIPETWNRLYKEYLGIEVPNDRLGCLQDVHWSFASFGYFPTYTLGNLYCAQFFEAALQEMPDLMDDFTRGEFTRLKDWLNRNIHAHGQRWLAADLCEQVTGKPLSAEPLMRHLNNKLRPIYGI
ncbi:MAG: carboxypeptidase M32 [Phycisphaerae bacterium]|nr:carboxypeptidase M32 [Phycisphaerae bacterium]